MNIKQMKYVVAVADNGSFREAAKKLFITQPSLSNGIKELEDELGVNLFTRTNKGALLTEEGIAFLESAEKILTQLSLLENRYQHQQKETRFSISSQHYDFLGGIMAKTVQKFGNQYKEFRLFETTTLKVIEDVKSYHSELGILYLNSSNRSGIKRHLSGTNLIYDVVGCFDTHIFLGNHHPLAHKKELTLEQLVHYPQVRFIQEGSEFSYLSEDLVEENEQDTVISVNDRGTLMNILAETNSYASGSGILTGFTKKEIKLIPLVQEEENKICIIYQKNQQKSAILTYFINELKTIISK
ncbi:LysR family transcriptional regulator [Enterococcus sp. CWB-B31]|uniref:LysR family transcriptional regulator n=1 Tax=Enterococcus sp. CWB-B31 TaxID=2885159 RepID=UPI001E51281F|nr:LysR family transcriptional regulator [Enterococcus sp. CWB-B31]MCB5955892.1 LysR family transcriptional regulator [Enterococcus sp. CWB-B31]